MSRNQKSSLTSLMGMRDAIVVDDSGHLLSYMLTIKGSDTIIFVLDNAGYELFCDLVLAHVITKRYSCRIVFEVKSIPWFVSDSTERDIAWLLDECLNLGISHLSELVYEWKGLFSKGLWVIKSSLFWTTVCNYWEMPEVDPDLFSSLSNAKLIIFKGDLNYRKMVCDAMWDGNHTFQDAVGPFAHSASFCMLRTCKSDTVAGVNGDIRDRLFKMDKDWTTNGSRALIQFLQKG